MKKKKKKEKQEKRVRSGRITTTTIKT